MIDEKYIDLVTAYIDNSITAGQREELNRLIDEGEIDILDVKEMEMTWQKIGRIPSAEPAADMQKNFYRMLEEEKQKQPASPNNTFADRLASLRQRLEMRQLAYALGVFLVGMLVGNWVTPFNNYREQLSELSTEVSQMREVMMLSLLDNASATERLKAVNISTDVRSADNRVIEALLKTLNNDPNINVRLATIEALLRHATNPLVREGMVNAIAGQESPLVQVALADAMITLQERSAIPEFRDLLEKNGLDQNARDKIENTIAALS